MKRGLRYCRTALVIALALAFAAVPSLAADRERALYIEGARMQGDMMHVYFQAVTSEPLTQERIGASLDGATLTGAALYPYTYADAGVTWCVITDIASSEVGRAMQDAKACARAVMERMLTYDAGCVVSAAPADTKIELSTDKDMLCEAAGAIERNPRGADLYATVGNAVTTLRQNDGTGRRCVLLLSDAMGNYDGDAQQAKALAEEAGVPIYVVALLYGTEGDKRLENAAKLKELALMSHGGAYGEVGVGTDALEAAAPALSFRENGYTLVLSPEDVRSCTGAASAQLTITTEDGVLKLSDTYTLDLSAIPAPEATPAPAVTLTATPQSTQESTPAPTSEPEEPIERTGLTLPWIIGIGVGGFLVAAVAVCLLLRGKKRKRPFDPELAAEETDIPDTDGSEAGAGDGEAARLSLYFQSACERAASFELEIEEKLVIGSDPKRAQLILSGLDGVQCMLTRHGDELLLLPGDTPDGTCLNGRPATQETRLRSGDELRFNGLAYKLLWR